MRPPRRILGAAAVLIAAILGIVLIAQCGSSSQPAAPQTPPKPTPRIAHDVAARMATTDACAPEAVDAATKAITKWDGELRIGAPRAESPQSYLPWQRCVLPVQDHDTIRTVILMGVPAEEAKKELPKQIRYGIPDRPMNYRDGRNDREAYAVDESGAYITTRASTRPGFVVYVAGNGRTHDTNSPSYQLAERITDALKQL